MKVIIIGLGTQGNKRKKYLGKDFVASVDPFKKQAKYTIFDDHVPLYQMAGIPAIDIIDFDFPNEKTNYHHTHQDIVQNCSPKGLGEVGTLMLNHIYNIK